MTIDIRTARPEDAAAIQAIYAPVVVDTAISFEDAPPSVEEMQQRIASTLQTGAGEAWHPGVTTRTSSVFTCFEG
jgi:L-amino acid N-acyltransferase YncA